MSWVVSTPDNLPLPSQDMSPQQRGALLKQYVDARWPMMSLEDGWLSGYRFDFSLADLRGVHLADANLRDGFLKGSDLRGACLTNADLRGADFSNADLRGVQLDGAMLDGAIFHGAQRD